MSSYDNGLDPAWNRLRNLGKDDGLAEHRSSQDIPNLSMCKHGTESRASQEYDTWIREILGTYGAVRTSPHLLQVELFDTGFVRRDSRAFDTDTATDNGFGSVNCYFVIALAWLMYYVI